MFRSIIIVIALLIGNGCSSFTNTTTRNNVKLSTTITTIPVTIEETHINKRKLVNTIIYHNTIEHEIKFSFESPTSSSLNENDTKCLTQAIYFEARGEGSEGMAAVAFIVLNRAALQKKSICAIVHAPSQFSFYTPGRERPVKEPESWKKSWDIAVDAQLGKIQNPIGNATSYNSVQMPDWVKSDKLVMTKRINGHYFYTKQNLIKTEALSKGIPHTIITNELLQNVTDLSKITLKNIYNFNTFSNIYYNIDNTSITHSFIDHGQRCETDNSWKIHITSSNHSPSSLIKCIS